MGKDTKIVIGIAGDTKSFEKSLDQAARKLERTRKATKKTDKEVDELGRSFSQAANNVAIFNGQLDPISGRLSAIGTGITRFGVGNLALAAGLGAITLAIRKSVLASDEYETRQLRFNSLLKATSYQSGLTANDLEALANQIGNDTLSNTEEAAGGINALLTFRKVQGETFKETVRLARDAQVAFGGNLREGVVAFGKALNDPIANLGALSRKGIQFDDVQKEMIKNLWETGDAAGAQNIILEEMRNQFGGLAKDEAKTLAGALDGLGHAWDRMWERAGQTDKMQAFSGWIEGIIVDNTKLLDLISHSMSIKNQEEINNTLVERASVMTKLAGANDKLAGATKDLQLLEQAYSDTPTNFNKKMVDSAASAYDTQVAQVLKFEKEKHKLTVKYQTLKGVVVKNALDEERKIEIANKSKIEGDKAANEKAYADIVKNGEKIIRANESRFETQRDKAKRFRDESVKNLSEQHDKEEAAAKKSGKNLTDIHIKYSDQIQIAEEGYQDKLDEIDRRESDRSKAKLNRQRREIKLLESAAKKRAKLLNDIDSGGAGGKLAKLKQDYEQEVALLESSEWKKSEWVKLGFETRKDFLEDYMITSFMNYDDDVTAFNEAETAKTLKMQEEAAKRAASQFGDKIDESFGDVENSAGGFQDFFGVNIEEQQLKKDALFELKKAAIAENEALNISEDAKEKTRQAIKTKFSIEQAKLEKEGRRRAAQDTWSALATLGSSGSKKLFAINKAANIAQTIMSTITGATNAYRDLPFPFSVAASAAIGLAGLVNVNKIRSQQMPQFHDGITDVPREGSYLLAQGERVLSSQLNSDLKEDLKNRKQSGGEGGETIINLTIPDTGNYNAVDQWYEDNADRIVNHVKYAMNRP